MNKENEKDDDDVPDEKSSDRDSPDENKSSEKESSHYTKDPYMTVEEIEAIPDWYKNENDNYWIAKHIN